MHKSITILAAAGLLAACAHPAARPEDVAKDGRHCLTQTGSRIAPPPGECINAPGQVVTREEIDRTGAFTTFDALRLTVPQAH